MVSATGYRPPATKPLCPPLRPPRHADVVFAEVEVAGGRAPLLLDVYQDPGRTEPGPCVVYYFGGGWSHGDHTQATQRAVYCRDLVELTAAGLTVVTPDYRLVHQAPLPACVHDAKGAIRFLRANAERFLIDPDRIGVLGNSAGGHLASMVALSAGDPSVEGDTGGNRHVSSTVRACVSIYGVADLPAMIEASATRARPDLSGTEVADLTPPPSGVECALLGFTGEGRTVADLARVVRTAGPGDADHRFADLAERFSPIHHVRADNPPTLILHGGADPLVPITQSRSLYEAMTAAGADATFLSYSHGGHGPSLGPEVDGFAYSFLTSRL